MSNLSYKFFYTILIQLPSTKVTQCAICNEILESIAILFDQKVMCCLVNNRIE